MSYYECIGHSQAELDASYSNGYSAGVTAGKNAAGNFTLIGYSGNLSPKNGSSYTVTVSSLSNYKWIFIGVDLQYSSSKTYGSFNWSSGNYLTTNANTCGLYALSTVSYLSAGNNVTAYGVNASNTISCYFSYTSNTSIKVTLTATYVAWQSNKMGIIILGC